MVEAITGTAAATTGRAAQDAQKLADDLNDFMTLLTTQLQHQDPLDPMDATEFTSQLVQFASVEQQIAQNSNLETLITAQENSQLSSVAGYVGHYIEAESSNVQVYGGQAEFNYILHEDAASTLITIQDASGRTVMTADGNLTQGKHGVVWDGTDLQGNQVPDGIYNLTVVAQDGDGAPVDITTTTLGIVSGVSYAGKDPILMINNQEIALDQVLTLQEEAVKLSEVDTIAQAALTAKGYSQNAEKSKTAAAASAAEIEALATANPDTDLSEYVTAANDAVTAANEAATAAAEAATNASDAATSGIAAQAAQAAATAAANAAKAASDAATAATAATAAITA
ncbi:flagellar hook assembly protein FlgD [Terasakiella sp. A23]|uniref:flagellar hook assembly protein FlgD n=1 Tax=Terasakiella sp. FCG-A23 TaxID=3080561 RepID=UPI002952B078|nr:flagellar hook assembly protein FlgD [Terasakiella sp. A23]MDV7339013.1 flagellar hook assembly protein FlgD [Terasakiella sp. A23]